MGKVIIVHLTEYLLYSVSIPESIYNLKCHVYFHMTSILERLGPTNRSRILEFNFSLN